MAIFVSKYKNYRVGLKRGYSEIVNGYKETHKPIKAEFKNYIFNTESSTGKRIPLDEKKIIKKLRKNKFFGKDFWEKDKEPITLNTLLNKGIRDLREIIDEVEDMTLLKRAIDKEYEKEGIEGEEPRKTAIELFKDRLEDLMGEVE